jgi:hypothetical protein
MRAIDDLAAQAMQEPIQVPLVRAVVRRPGTDGPTLDLGAYVQGMTLEAPPLGSTLSPSVLTLTLANPNGRLARHPLLRPDYRLDLWLGFWTQGTTAWVPMGVYWLDGPDLSLGTSFAASRGTSLESQLTVKARDGIKLLIERAFTVDEWVDLRDMSVADAIRRAVEYATVAGEAMDVVFDTDDDSQAVLSDRVLEVTATAGDQLDTVAKLLEDILKTNRLLAACDAHGRLRVGMMRALEPVVATFGRGGRPIHDRQFKASGREPVNWVHVEGDRVSADAVDQANIDAIGRVKYKYVDDPEIDTVDVAQRRADQELELATRLLVQPDFTSTWQLDLERRDLIQIVDDILGVDGVYRVENLTYTFDLSQGARTEVGVGSPTAEPSDTTGAARF